MYTGSEVGELQLLVGGVGYLS